MNQFSYGSFVADKPGNIILNRVFKESNLGELTAKLSKE